VTFRVTLVATTLTVRRSLAGMADCNPSNRTGRVTFLTSARGRSPGRPLHNLRWPEFKRALLVVAMHPLVSRVRVATYFAAFATIGLAQWIHHSFGSPTIDQIVYHLRFNEGLVADTGHAFRVTFAVECLVVPLVLAFIAGALETLVSNAVQLEKLSGRLRGIARWCGRALPWAALAASVGVLLAQLSLPAYARSRLGADYFSLSYVSPASVNLEPGRLKNLVLIYVEGLEDAYADRRLFGRDLLHSLHALEGARLQHYRAAPGTTFTMGGIVGTQCGIPLKAMGLEGVATSGERRKTFLPNATCLGDILQPLGYRNVFMGGARLAFAGKGHFLRDHGYGETYGKENWLEQGVAHGSMNDWGLHDDDLFAKAKLKLRELHEAAQPFNLTLLTLDTHHPTGFYSKQCKREGVTDFAGIVECTARQVADFINHAKRNGWLKNTQVVIVGDHLAMPNPVSRSLASSPQRTIFSMFISDEPVQIATDAVVLPFDMFPTILQFVGVRVEGGRLGLGRAAFADAPARRPAEDLEALMADVMNPSAAYEQLWRSH
jgi:phosphoglycerol transferase